MSVAGDDGDDGDERGAGSAFVSHVVRSLATASDVTAIEASQVHM